MMYQSNHGASKLAAILLALILYNPVGSIGKLAENSLYNVLKSKQTH